VKNILIILSLILYCSLSIAQDSNAYTPNYVLSLSTDIGYGSSNINNQFIDKLIYGGHIDDELKGKVLSKTKKTNRIGLEVNYEMKFYNFKDTFLVSLPQYRYFIGFGSFTNISAKFSSDFFKTTFFGNKSFVGKTADLSNTNIFQSEFKKISFGLINFQKNTSFSISLISGEKHNLFDFKTAELYTAPNGQKLTLNYEGSIEKSDSLSNGFLSFSGSGIALDFSTRIKNILNLSATNLGFVVWGRNPSVTTMNNQYSFNGLEVDNLFDNNTFNINNTIDSILPLPESKNITKLLPAIFKLEKVINPEKKIQAIYGIRYKILSNYIPLVHLGAFYSFNHKIKSSTTLTYGGYNNLEANLNLFYATNKLYVGIGTNNLIGNFSQSGYGKSLSFSLMSRF
jgi:hypothetical protein